MSTPERKTPKASLGYPREARITRGAELQRIAREGKRIWTTHVEVRIAVSPLVRTTSSNADRPRVGLIVPKYKHSGVARNQLKRRLRELSRLEIIPEIKNGDIVLRARANAYSASFEELSRDIALAVKQIMQQQDIKAADTP